MKSTTDQFWNERASKETDDAKVNIADTVQRDHELQFIFSNLSPSFRLLEVGCGNGYVSQQLRERVAALDSFDYAESMIARARRTYGETNNRFFHDSLFAPRNIGREYDAVLCVRVLINLRNLEEQKLAIQNMAKMLRRGGRLVLVEGFQDGFNAINLARRAIGLSEAKPAEINFYSYISDLMPTILENFCIERTWHTGLFDFLTRVVYPQLVGADNAVGSGEFHAKIEPIIRTNSLSDLAIYARVRGFILSRHDGGAVETRR